MSQNQPDHPKSPVPLANPDTSQPKKAAPTLNTNKTTAPPAVPSPAPSVTRKPPPSPLSKSSELKDESKQIEPEAVEEKVEDFDKYEVKRAAIGTGIFSSLLTLSTLIFINEVRFFLYYREYLSLNPFRNFLFSAGFLISLFHLIVFGAALFVPSYLLQGNKILKLSPLLVAILLQLFMLHFHESDADIKVFIIQGWYGKYLMVKDFLMSYGSFFGSCFIFFCMSSAYNTPINKIFRIFEFVDYPEEETEEKDASPV